MEEEALAPGKEVLGQAVLHQRGGEGGMRSGGSTRVAGIRGGSGGGCEIVAGIRGEGSWTSRWHKYSREEGLGERTGESTGVGHGGQRGIHTR